ncbi:DUF308 domain-containing protein [Paeniglutamicibacter sp. Y32M11]|uniref:DUF308 domain-containing protein n=1 Tax=Paeniglutamicibacter sp. Y32M11 TaxID=2853258 RepID=UPI001C52F5FA|nr:DUF308 domain-containing protein [Paeniglutamicibacter sp. Y32M11]QXQ10915.1 hypothetical protein KUF55_03000 [Paeniglutamicibacter sp. Y32M11]
MSDPNTRPGGDPNQQSWSAPSGYQGQYIAGQQQYPGQYAAGQQQYPGAYPGQYPAYGYYPNGGQQSPPRSHGMTIFAMIIGITAAAISLVPFLGFVAYVLGPVAMVLGIIGIAQRYRRRGYSITALVTGTFGLLVSVLYTILFSTLISVAQNTQTYEFTADGTAEYKVTMRTGVDGGPDGTSTQNGPFSQMVEALTLFGGMSITNLTGEPETVSCRINDSAGNLLIEDTATGPFQTATCDLRDVLVHQMEDIDFPEELSAGQPE